MKLETKNLNKVWRWWGKESFLLFFDHMGRSNKSHTIHSELLNMHAFKCCKNSPFYCFDFCFLERMKSLIITFKSYNLLVDLWVFPTKPISSWCRSAALPPIIINEAEALRNGALTLFKQQLVIHPIDW